MDKNQNQKVIIRFIMFYEYAHFEQHRTEWTTFEKDYLICRPSILMEYDDTINFEVLARRLELSILGYLSTRLEQIEFKFKHDFMRREERLCDVGLKSPGPHDLWIFSPHLFLAVVNRDIRTLRDQLKE